jgi:hypothetical protein
MAHKNRKKIKNSCFVLLLDVLFCGLKAAPVVDVLHGGLKINKLKVYRRASVAVYRCVFNLIYFALFPNCESR